MNFEALRRRVERAETLVQDRAGETGQQVDSFKRAWREGWTPGRIIVAGLAGGFLAGRMEPSAKLTASLRGSLTGARWLQMIGTVSSMLASLRRELTMLSQGRHTIGVDDASATDLVGSPRELHSAFSNLVSNAVRYTPAGGRITIRYEATAHGVALAVEDTGYGIPAAHLPRITERFYRVSTSRSRESGGTGLGLAIVKHVLHLHQARLEIDSEVGRGSRFACHFTAERVRPREAAYLGATG